MIYRLFVEKKKGFDISAIKIKDDLNNLLKLNIEDIKIFLRYDVADIDKDDIEKAVFSIFSEPPADNVYIENLPDLRDYTIFGIEFLPGQYDQRADSAAQCVQLLTRKNRPVIKCAVIYAVKGAKDFETERIIKYLINPVESRQCKLEKPESLITKNPIPKPVKIIDGFINMNYEALQNFYNKSNFAMAVKDLAVVQKSFKNENRNPNEAELKVIDTYWSDHCRHTTFLTELKSVIIESDNPHISQAYKKYVELFNKHYINRTDKYRCLMDIATIAVKELKSQEKLDNLDESEEINACSIIVKANVDGQEQDWLVMFKNETHNHPTEIEPFGGAATCLGGAIRDPLSGRVYVYQAMRITGAADPTVPLDKTIKGKLPQRIITRSAAAGYSSYGNQIGLATGLVREIYHPNYVSKRLETGFVVGAAPMENVVRSTPQKGDIVVLIGGETGRDGIGGATGSSVAHTVKSVDTAGAEVQKGNPLTERKIQRLFRKKEVSQLIKRCNDFGAGGVCVAIGELASGLDIYLDRIPKKYEGLNILELAVSESQERMAVVVNPSDLEKLISFANEENVAACAVAKITNSNRLTMYYDGEVVIDIDRTLLDSNGAKQFADVKIIEKNIDIFDGTDDIKDFLNKSDYISALKKKFSNLNICSQKGLVEMFDSTIGNLTVIMPFGGKYQLTPSLCMAARLPVIDGTTTTVTVSSWGFNPEMMLRSPFVGAVYSVISSVLRVVAGGADPKSIKLTFQEYFLRLREDSLRWGIPTAALLGAMEAQLKLGLGAIGGKDSMSGTFEDMDVPPTLISFALGIADSRFMGNNVLENSGTEIVWLKLKRDAYGMPNFDYFNKLIEMLHREIVNKNIYYIQDIDEGGAAVAAIKSALGNGLGIDFYINRPDIFNRYIGDCLIAVKNEAILEGLIYEKLGIVTNNATQINNQAITFSEILNSFTKTLEKIFPTKIPQTQEIKTVTYNEQIEKKHCTYNYAKPRVFIPVFPGTNCEYDTMTAFEKCGAIVKTFVIRNRNSREIEQSVIDMKKLIKTSQIIALPGGFSGGDEPDGSGKFIATTFRNPYLKEAITELLQKRDGLAIGICNGFQALIKLGLLPYGEISEIHENSPTLTFNSIGRHISSIVRVRVSSVKSPWLYGVQVGDIFGVPISHGEGRFVAKIEDLKKMEQQGQIFSQYVDENGNVNADMENYNGSVWAIEGITSFNGKILGKMGHIERCQNGFKNIALPMDMKIFESGIKYFK